MKKYTSILAILILALTLTSFTFSNTVENSDIKIAGDRTLDIVKSVETSWDNPNAWSLQDDPDIVKVISIDLLDEEGKKIKNEKIDASLSVSIKVPKDFQEGFEEYQIVVFDGTDIRDYIPCTYSNGWLAFECTKIEDFGIAIPGVSDGNGGAMLLDGSSREKFYGMDFRKIFLYVGIGLVIMIPFCIFGALRLTKRELREQYEKQFEDQDNDE